MGKGPLELLLSESHYAMAQLTKEEQAILTSLETNTIMTNNFKRAVKRYIIGTVYRERNIIQAREE